VEVLGCGFTLAGCAGSFVVRFGFLGRWWSAKITVQDGQQIVDRGPYAIIRHPLYALSALTYAGAALVFPIWWIVAACAVAVAGYVLLARAEDDYMARNLAGYAAYRQRVRFGLIPGLW
jgi:protein-S-isoprenylcysteine O-methyltransferase Ste14